MGLGRSQLVHRRVAHNWKYGLWCLYVKVSFGIPTTVYTFQIVPFHSDRESFMTQAKDLIRSDKITRNFCSYQETHSSGYELIYLSIKLNPDYLKQVRNQGIHKNKVWSVTKGWHTLAKFVGKNHTDKIRVQMPTKIFPHLKLKC
jgi:hypothetical protein